MSVADVLAGARPFHVEQADVLDGLARIPDGVVQCTVTSPPYWGLRDYGEPGQIGLERTPDEYVARLVEVFREVRRVLRDDGVLWLNLGDCYATGAGKVGECPGGGAQGERWASTVGPMMQPNRLPLPGLKPKDLIGVPWMVAFALRADGWYLRSDVIWHKPNPMPESVEDRPTKAHEYLFLMSKSERYFYDREAVKEPMAPASTARYGYAFGGAKSVQLTAEEANGPGTRTHPIGMREAGTGRNRRSVWTVATRPCAEAHFATFPPALVEPCIKAGTSERGCCPKCGAPWERVTERHDHGFVDGRTFRSPHDTGDDLHRNGKGATTLGHGIDYETVGWRQSCECPAAPAAPCIVLDPFNGAGTTGVVATRLRRRYLGIELSPKYVDMSVRRIEGDAPLFNRVAGSMS